MTSHFPSLVTSFLAQESAMPAEVIDSSSQGLGTPAIFFIFIAFLVVAKLIAKNFEGKQQLALKRIEMGQDIVAPQPVTNPENPSKNYFWLLLLVVGLSLLLFLCISSAILFFGLQGKAVSEVATIASGRHSTTKIASVPTAEFVSSATHQEAVSTPEFVERKTIEAVKQALRIEKWKTELPFPANQYSGVESCAIPLARRIHEELKPDVQAEVDNSEVTTAPTFVVNIEKLKANGDAAFLDQFKSAFKKLNPDIRIVDAEAERMTDGNAEARENLGAEYDVIVRASIKKRYSDKFPDRSLELRDGIVVCQLQRKGDTKREREKTFSVKFTDAPWLNDFEKFARLDPSQEFYVGLSDSFEQSADTAHQIALDDVANQFGRPFLDLNSSTYYRSFQQKITRPYGEVYREAILVIDAGKRFAGHRDSSRHAPASGKSLHIDPERGVAVLAIMTVMLTFIANAVTQGYYRTGLSRTSLVACSLAVIFIILIVVLNFA